jgi:hypothetical protein
MRNQTSCPQMDVIYIGSRWLFSAKLLDVQQRNKVCFYPRYSLFKK